MRTLILMGCGVFAAACASNKPPESQNPAQYSSQESSSASTATPSTNNGSQTWTAEPTPAARNGTTGPRPGDSTLGTVGDTAAQNRSTGPATDPAPAPNTEPDNTRVNKRDKSSAALTPMDQGNSDADLKLTQNIRKAVMADSSLSFTAKNVKIISVNGKVTLRGPVKTDHERQVIGDQARKIAGAGNVDDQLEVTK